jgi:hypothetical protein
MKTRHQIVSAIGVLVTLVVFVVSVLDREAYVLT